MNVEKLRILTGGDRCNADCPYCITKMVRKHASEPSMNWKRFDTACKYSKMSGASAVMIGGIGEPTLYPECVLEILERLKKYNFPIIEMETNGYLLSQESYNCRLEEWSSKGLTTIQVSILNHDSNTNSKTMKLPYYDIGKLVSKLHDYNYSVRLSCVLYKGGVDSVIGLEKLVSLASSSCAEQLILHPVAIPYNPKGSVLSWVKSHELTRKDKKRIIKYLEDNGEKILTAGNKTYYDISGQAVISTELKDYNPLEDEVKQLTLFPKGTIRYDRRYKAAILL